ncbi:hypothetical protein H0H87_002998 [Tephrocybe sp. NHM501043]|nr:hypothetical protein H0H87_002998 [Tephrocybe sp. NHM501043]
MVKEQSRLELIKKKECSHDEALKRITQLIACDDQALGDIKQWIEDAPGKICAMADGWSADTTKAPFLGMTIHFVEVDKTGSWKLAAEVVGFKLLSGAHSGDNLGQYFVGLCERVRIIGPRYSKLGTMTLDNTLSNTTLSMTVEKYHAACKLVWNAKQNQLLCTEHVVQLVIKDVMSSLTKTTAIKNATAIWE